MSGLIYPDYNGAGRFQPVGFSLYGLIFRYQSFRLEKTLPFHVYVRTSASLDNADNIRLGAMIAPGFGQFPAPGGPPPPGPCPCPG